MRPYLHALSLVVVVGCSGAEIQDVLGAADGSASSSASSSSSSSGSSGTTTSSSSSSSTSSSSGGADASVDASPPSNCPSETEPNDNKNTANTIDTTMCGAINPRNDQDFLTFDLPATAKTLNITYTGDVIVEVTVLGQTVTLGNDAKVPFLPAQRYTIEVRGTGKTDNTPWQVNVSKT